MAKQLHSQGSTWIIPVGLVDLLSQLLRGFIHIHGPSVEPGLLCYHGFVHLDVLRLIQLLQMCLGLRCTADDSSSITIGICKCDQLLLAGVFGA